MKTPSLLPALALLGLSLSLLPHTEAAVLAGYRFDTGLAPDTTAPGLSATNITGGMTVSRSSNAQGNPTGHIWARSWNMATATTPQDAVTGNKYFQFSLTLGDEGNELRLDTLSFDYRLTRLGAVLPNAETAGHFWRTSLDNFTANLRSSTAQEIFVATNPASSQGGSWSTATLDLSTLGPLVPTAETPLTFRLYLTNSYLGSHDSTDTMINRIDNIIINGTVAPAPIPEPSTLALLPLAAGAWLWLRRRG